MADAERRVDAPAAQSETQVECSPREGPTQPANVAARPLTLPEGTLALEAGTAYVLTPITTGLTFALRLGILDDLEFDFAEAFMWYMPAGPLVGLRGRLLAGELELGLSGQVRLPGLGGLPGGYFAVEARARLDEIVRIDAAFSLAALARVWVRGASDAPHDDSPSDYLPLDRGYLIGLVRYSNTSFAGVLTAEPGIPLSVTVAPIEELHFALATGFGIADFSAPSTMFIPLDVSLGVTVAVDGAPMLDIDFSGGWPYLFVPVAAPSGAGGWPNFEGDTRVQPRLTRAAIAVRGYLDAW